MAVLDGDALVARVRLRVDRRLSRIRRRGRGATAGAAVEVETAEKEKAVVATVVADEDSPKDRLGFLFQKQCRYFIATMYMTGYGISRENRLIGLQCVCPWIGVIGLENPLFTMQL